MSSVADVYPGVVDLLHRSIDEAIHDLNIYGSVIKWTSLVTKLASMMNVDVPSPKVSSYLRFLDNARKYEFENSIAAVTDSLWMNSASVQNTQGILAEMDIPSLVNRRNPAADSEALRDAYNVAKANFPDMDAVRHDKGDIHKHIDLWGTLMSDVALIAPSTSLRFDFKDRGTLGNAVAGIRRSDNVTAANQTVRSFSASQTGLFEQMFRDLAGTVASTAFEHTVWLTPRPGTYVFTPAGFANLGAVPSITSANVNVGAVIEVPTAEAIAPSLRVYDRNNLLQRSALLSYTQESSILIKEGDYLNISFPADTSDTILSGASTAYEFMWEAIASIDTGVFTTIKLAVADNIEYEPHGRGVSLDYMYIVDKYLTNAGKVSFASAIRAQYLKIAGVNDLASVSDAALYSLHWWVGRDTRVTDRNALAITYEKLHQTLRSYLPFAMVSFGLDDFLTQ
jgi:hypothetical protein